MKTYLWFLNVCLSTFEGGESLSVLAHSRSHHVIRTVTGADLKRPM